MTSSILSLLLNFTILMRISDFSGSNLASVDQNQKARLIVFSGSDWCKNCILFQNNVLNDPQFKSFANENLEIIIADFPQKATLSKEQVDKNEVLAEKYNPDGVFPKLIILSGNDLKHKVVPFNNQSSDEFIKDLKKLLPAR